MRRRMVLISIPNDRGLTIYFDRRPHSTQSSVIDCRQLAAKARPPSRRDLARANALPRRVEMDFIVAVHVNAGRDRMWLGQCISLFSQSAQAYSGGLSRLDPCVSLSDTAIVRSDVKLVNAFFDSKNYLAAHAECSPAA